MPALTYELIHQDTTSHARLGRVTTPHGVFDTPAFMPVGTQGTVKGVLPGQVRETGAQIVLGNTYHLLLRPGSELVAKMGGLQRWTGWRGPMLTDSGGFQVFSLAGMNDITENGVRFKSHLDGSMIELTPERSMQVQHELGADIIMAFDDCPPAMEKSDHQKQRVTQFQNTDGNRRRPTDAGPDDIDEGVVSGVRRPPAKDSKNDRAAYTARVKLANERTLRWLDRCVAYHHGAGRDAVQALFPIVQGGTDLAQRDWCVERICQHDAPGYAIGGVAVGEGTDEIRKVVEHTAPKLPGDRPRYLMGVGYERDIVAAVRAGVDMFDCVLPTRNGRNAVAFTPTGPIRLKNAGFKDDPRPIQEGCDCPTCGGAAESHFSRSYLRHLFHAGEMLGPTLVSLHNLRHFQRLLLDIRRAIRDNGWSFLARDWPVAFPD